MLPYVDILLYVVKAASKEEGYHNHNHIQNTSNIQKGMSMYTYTILVHTVYQEFSRGNLRGGGAMFGDFVPLTCILHHKENNSDKKYFCL